MLSHEPDPVLAQLTPPQQDEHSGTSKIKDYGMTFDIQMYRHLVHLIK